jgi:hypothetical protein
MENVIRNKLIDIESKLSNDSLLQLKTSTVFAEENTQTITRHSMLSRDNTSDAASEVARLISTTAVYMSDLNRLSNFFYNNKEMQLGSLIARMEAIELRNRILKSLTNGIQVFPLVFNDRKLLKAAGNYDISQGGLTFNPLITKEISPTVVEISRNSNVRIGDVNDPMLRSKREALFSEDPNDIYSVNNINRDDLKFFFDCTFESKQVINQVIFSHIKKPQQSVRLQIINKVTAGLTTREDVIWDGIVEESTIYLEKPAITDRVFVKVTASYTPGYGTNQLDMKRLAFIQQEYDNKIFCETINLPALNNKFLTVEEFKLAHNENSDLFKFTVKANEAILSTFDSGDKAAGPYRDPYLTIEVQLKNIAEIIKYLSPLRYRVSNIEMVGYENKVFAKFGNEKELIITQEREAGDEVFFPFPVPEYESHLEVRLNGMQVKRSLTSDALVGYSYFIEYTGSGYVIRFANGKCPLGSVVMVDIRNTPSYIDSSKLFLPDLGLGTHASVSYAKELKRKRIPIFTPERNNINIGVKNIQNVSFYDLLGREITIYTERSIRSNLISKEYAVDYRNGIVYIGQDVDGILDVSYLEDARINTLLEEGDFSIPIPSDIKSFTHASPLINLNSASFCGFQKHNKSVTDFNLDYSVIKLPAYITLHKGSLRLSGPLRSRREVPFIDGRTELFQSQTETAYYDYINTEINTHTYLIRNPLTAGDIGLIEDIIFENEYMTNKLEYSATMPVINAMTEGEWRFTSLDFGRLSIKNSGFPSVPALTIKAKIIKDISKDVFSVDYKTNTIYTRNLNDLNGTISFTYSCISLNAFTIAKEIDKKPIIQNNEYFVYAYNKEEIEKLLPFYTPVIECINIGTIG